MTLTFHPNATATCLYTDAIPLQSLGTLSVRRASWIDWHEPKQRWEVRFEPHAADPVFHDTSREECLRWERMKLES